MNPRFRWSSALTLLALAAFFGCSENPTAPAPSPLGRINSTNGVGGLGQIGNFVWNDLNANGLQDPGEPGIPGVVLNLAGSEVQTKTTSATGGYAFTGLTGGTYQVTVNAPAGMVASPTLVGPARGVDSNVSGANVTTTATGSTANDITIDFGFYTPAGRIGDFVWSDLNGNGVQDLGEPGIAGVTVMLTGPGSPQSMVTGPTGAYAFTGLVPGCYTVAATDPAGYTPTAANAGAPANDSNTNPATVCLALPNSVDTSIDFGYVQDSPLISIVKLTNGSDNNFAPGIMLAAGSPVTWTYNVTNTGNVTLTNVMVNDDKAGFVCTIPSLVSGASTSCTMLGTAVAGSYTNIGTVIGTPPTGPNVTANDPDNYFGSAPSIALVKKTNGTDNNTAPGISIITGTPVTWTYEATNTGNVALTNVTITDDKVGSICVIPSLAPGASSTCTRTGVATTGQYTNLGSVTGTPPVGADVTAQDPDNYNGYEPAIGSISDFVWNDLNADGMQDPGEVGIGGVTVSLTGPGGPRTTTTDANGIYIFDMLSAGCYTVQAGTPTGYAPTTANTGSPSTDSEGSPASVCLPTNSTNNTTVDFGFVADAPSLSLVKLTNASDNNVAPGVSIIVGSPVTWTYTARNTGNVLLTNVTITDDKVGTICAVVSLAAGASAVCTKTGIAIEGQYTNMGTVTGTPPTGANVTAQDPDNYFGYVPNTGTIGDFVWKDLNGNGVQDSGEPGIAGVAVSLTGPGAPQSISTDANGAYQFSLLTAGCYTVTVAPPAGYSATTAGAGSSSTDSNGSPATVCLPANNSTDATIDFGFIQDAPSITLVKLTNGTDNNTAPGASIVAGSAVSWTYTAKNTGNVILTNVTITDDRIGAVCVIPSLAPGASSTCTKAGVATAGQYTNLGTVTGTPPTGSNVTASDPDNYFGYIPNVATIGDFVWKDLNGDGIQNSGEPGISGVLVTLTGPGGPLTAVTDASGAYLFSNLSAGCYTITAATPAGLNASPAGAGGDVSKDSNGSPASVCLAANNSSNLTIDFGFVAVVPATGKIGDWVWKDYDQSGAQSAADFGLVATVRLNGPGGLVSTQTTGSDGKYLFTGLAAGCYTVTVVTEPANMAPIPTDVGSNDAVDSDPSGVSVCLATNSSQDLTVDFGYYHATSKIGDFVWKDTDGDGRQDTSEPGIAGQTVTLVGPYGTMTDVTDASGKYLFTGLGTGCYTITVATPTGYTPTTADVGSDENIDSENSGTSVCINGNAQTNLSIDFGFKTTGGAATGKIGDWVWKDYDQSGAQSAADFGLVATVRLNGPGGLVSTQTTGSDGKYLFTGLAAGCYTVTVVTEPANMAPIPTDVGSNDAVDSDPSGVSVCLATNSSQDLTVDFGYYHATSKIGDFVWKDTDGDGRQDTSEPGIAGRTVTLVGPYGTMTDVTDASGKYLFTGLGTGCYTITIATPTGYTPTTADVGSDENIDSENSGTSVCINGNAQTNLSIDFGFKTTGGAATGKIGDWVWKDYDQSGAQSAADFGLVATVRLNGPGGLVSTQTTGSDGKYLFTGLAAGCYTVTVVTEPANMAPIPTDVGSNDAVDSDPSGVSVCLATNSSQDLTVDFGYYHATSKIGDFVWKDTDGDGRQDTSEPGIAGRTVTLVGPYGTMTDVTDASGKYLFTGLGTGCYTITIATPTGYTPTTADVGSDENIDSENSGTSVCINGNAQTNLSIDFGFKTTGGAATGKIGDWVWKDYDQSGAQSAADFGLVATVRLNGPGGLVSTQTTGSDGKYLFTGLAAGCYTVTVVTEPANMAPIPTDVGSNDAVDSDPSGVSVCLATNSSQNLTVDFGYYHATSKIGDFVWKDTDGDGRQDTSEPGIAGRTVTLVGPYGTMTDVTDSYGKYQFTGLGTGCYTITIATPTGYTPTTADVGSDENIDSESSGTSVCINGNAQTNNSIDFGFKPTSGGGGSSTGSIGNRVWGDLNENGVQNAEEWNLPNITVKLLNCSGTVLSTTTTDSDGEYKFSSLAAGCYKVQVINPNTTYFKFTTMNAGSSDSADSDVDANGVTASINLTSGQAITTIDAGIRSR